MSNYKQELKYYIETTNGNVNSHYRFVKDVLLLLEEDDFEVDTFFSFNETTLDDNHTCLVDLSKHNKVIQLSFSWSNDKLNTPQTFGVSIIAIDEIKFINTMEITFSKKVFGDLDPIFRILFIDTINYYINHDLQY